MKTLLDQLRKKGCADRLTDYIAVVDPGGIGLVEHLDDMIGPGGDDHPAGRASRNNSSTPAHVFGQLPNTGVMLEEFSGGLAFLDHLLAHGVGQSGLSPCRISAAARGLPALRTSCAEAGYDPYRFAAEAGVPARALTDLDMRVNTLLMRRMVETAWP